MKKLMLIAALAVTTFGSTAWADTAAIAVSATVVGTCKFTGGGSIAFTLDPSTTAAANGVVTNPVFWCTRGTSYTVSDDFGIHEATAGSAPRRMQHSLTATEYIQYSLSYTSTGTGAGKTSPITLTLTSAVANIDFVNALAGSYADTVTVSITP